MKLISRPVDIEISFIVVFLGGDKKYHLKFIATTILLISNNYLLSIWILLIKCLGRVKTDCISKLVLKICLHVMYLFKLFLFFMWWILNHEWIHCTVHIFCHFLREKPTTCCMRWWDGQSNVDSQPVWGLNRRTAWHDMRRGERKQERKRTTKTHLWTLAQYLHILVIRVYLMLKTIRVCVCLKSISYIKLYP